MVLPGLCVCVSSACSLLFCRCDVAIARMGVISGLLLEGCYHVGYPWVSELARVAWFVWFWFYGCEVKYGLSCCGGISKVVLRMTLGRDFRPGYLGGRGGKGGGG